MMTSSENELLLTAQTIARQNKPSSYRLFQLLFYPGSLPFFCLGYAYFRWLDDLIDEPGASEQRIQTIIARQKMLISQMYETRRLPALDILNQQEQMLAKLIQYDLENQCYLRDYILEMFSALEFDAQRRYKISAQHDLDLYSTYLGKAYTRVLQVFTNPPEYSNHFADTTYYAGFAAHQIHILRDFYQDISLGYYNISQEDLSQFGWTQNNLSQADLHPWVYKTIQKAQVYFEMGLQSLGQVRSWQCRFLGYATSAQYLYLSETIKQDQYQLRSVYTPSKLIKQKMLIWALRATLFPKIATSYLTHRSQVTF